MECYQIFLVAAFLVAQVAGAEGTETSEESSQTIVFSVVAVVGGVIGLIAVVIACAETKVNPNVKRRGPPEWTTNLILKRELDEGFTDVSDGIHAIGPNHIQRERLGITTTDAARWNGPLIPGKHVFEINWPLKNNRGFCSCVGVGSSEVPLKKQGRVSLVGDHSQSWGLDMAKQRAIHFGKVQQRLYLPVPDRYYMYIDMESGTIGFGADVTAYGRDAEYFGNILTGIPKSKSNPMFLMVSMCQPNEQVQVYYKGSHTTEEGFDLIGGEPIYEGASKQKKSSKQSAPQANVVNVYTIAGGAPAPYMQAPYIQPAPYMQAPYMQPVAYVQPAPYMQQGQYQQQGHYQQQAITDGHQKNNRHRKDSTSSSDSSSSASKKDKNKKKGKY